MKEAKKRGNYITNSFYILKEKRDLNGSRKAKYFPGVYKKI